MTDDHKTTIKLMDKEYQIKCPVEKEGELQEAAAHLDNEMRKMRQSGMLGIDRVAIMAALHISYDLNITKKTYESYLEDNVSRIRHINSRIDDALSHAEQLEIID
jgi:cell division protein ZapA